MTKTPAARIREWVEERRTPLCNLTKQKLDNEPTIQSAMAYNGALSAFDMDAQNNMGALLKIIELMTEALEDHGVTHPISERALEKCAEILGE